MWLEAVAAALVGGSLVWLVFEPLVAAPGPRKVDPLDLDALEDFEDTRSGVALAALKEIEFDRETGKLSDADYEFLRQKYTLEAVSALRADEADASSDIELEVASRVARLQAESASARRCQGCGAQAGAGARFCPDCGRPFVSPTACAACGGSLLPGSRFCGACGGRVAA